jgi:hypothetical protein
MTTYEKEITALRAQLGYAAQPQLEFPGHAAQPQLDIPQSCSSAAAGIFLSHAAQGGPISGKS